MLPSFCPRVAQRSGSKTGRARKVFIAENLQTRPRNRILAGEFNDR